VALGASAGGLEVFQQFFDQMPAESGMAFILIQHLDPNHDTLMPELLAKHTSMRVLRVEDGLKIEANRVYVIAPSVTLAFSGCTLRVAPSHPSGDRKLIDHCFRSLAEDQKESVVGIVLSGTGSDGSAGLRAIKEQGGLTMAQSPDTAKFDSMPRNAISTGCVDFALPVGEMPGRIIEYVRHLEALHHRQGAATIQEEAVKLLPKIFPILRKQTGHDFSRYKQSTLARRIQRRMQVVYLDSVAKYVRYLRENTQEVDGLFKDLLIGVTQFFRDAENFQAIAKLVVPGLFEGKGAKDQVRIWVPGCATGEEAYSFAILLAEHAAGPRKKPKVQVFATDLDADALEVARKAKYPDEIANQISPDRLKRFFKKAGSFYEVADEVRELCIFSPHNLIKDPPFSRLDLLSCRNVLIYLEADLQKKLLPLFHYALNPSGYLFLGPSENIASRSEFFRTIDQKHRIFQRKPTLLHSPVRVPILDSGQITRLQGIAAAAATVPKEQGLARSIERVIIEEYAPASVIINRQGEVVYFSGNTGKYLEPPSGVPNNKVVGMARKNLRLELRTAVHRAITTGKEAVRENILIKSGRETRQIDLVVRPLTELGNEPELYIVLFRELIPAKTAGRPAMENFGSPEHPVVRQLESELRTTKDDLQTTIEELETSNEELKSANEELLSMNEELQSANEELQTSKEELQSANEELNRKIEEADAAAAELRRAHDDRARLAAIVQNSQDAIIGKTLDGIVTSWNEAAERIFGYSAEEMIGQSITKVIPADKLDEEVYILGRLRRGEAVQHYEAERVRKDGRRIIISLTSSPIRDAQGFVVGASKIARDVTERKEAEEAQLRLAAVVESSDDAIVTKTLDGVITSWNQAAERMYGYTAAEAIGKPVTMLIPRDRLDEEPAIIERLRKGEKINHYETVRQRKDGTRLDISLTVSPIKDASGRVVGASKVARDITGRKQADEARFRLAAVVDSSDDAIISKTLEGIILTWNKGAQRIFGYTAEEMIGKHITKLFPPERLDEEAHVVGQIRRGERVEHFETVRKTKDGRLIDISLTVSPIKDPLGKIIGASKIARDISERKQLEERLRKAKEELEDRVAQRTAALRETTEQLETFCYTIAHDLRSPLRAQQSFAQALLDEAAPGLDETGRDYASRILSSAQRLDRLVNDLLVYARLGRNEVKFERVELSKVVKDVVHSFAEQIEKQHATITTGALQAVTAHEPTLNLAVTNLVANAIKFVKPGESARVHVHSKTRGGVTRLWVEDRGIGIAAENLTKIFGVFQRLHPPDKYSGTGIGLALVQKGVERMGGKVGVEAELDRGSRFWIDLPAAAG
jgi:two-component system, chemotaxis family, CheB/CheR fusion protein